MTERYLVRVRVGVRVRVHGVSVSVSVLGVGDNGEVLRQAEEDPNPNPNPNPDQVPLRHLRAQARPLLLQAGGQERPDVENNDLGPAPPGFGQHGAEQASQAPEDARGGTQVRSASANQPRPISLLSGTSRVPLGPRWGRPHESGLSFTSRIGRACCGLADTVDPTAQMKHARNAELRVHSAVMETSLEIVFTWTGVILVLMYNVSADGRSVDTSTVISTGSQ